MAKPAFADNLLACYPALLARLQGVPGVKAVLEATELTALYRERRQLPLDGAVYVVLDGFTPQADNNRGREQLIELSFSIILVKRHFTPKPQTDGVGETLTAICKALQGFDPQNAQGQALLSAPFVQANAIPIRYEDGFAFFPLRFTAEVAVIADEGNN